MSSSIRQNNLFLAEDWQAVYRSFQDIDFRAYDFDTIRDSLIDYIRTYYPENFNDYIDSSEFIAIVELLAWLGSSLAFRVDLNSRENFLDTAERRESVIRLARMLNYQPRRNIAASGLLKLTAVETNEPVQDSRGRNLGRTTVFWNDPNNPDSFEQFVAVLNAAFSSTNPFGRPQKSGTIGSVPTDLYRFESSANNSVVYNVPLRVRNRTVPIDIVNVDFRDGEQFFERQPDFDNPFHLIYRNDGEGLGSTDTGFFLYFRQGTLQSSDTAFDSPVANRVLDIDVENINETDVYFQEIDPDGTVLSQWTSVPSLVGNNVIFNGVSPDQRDIFTVIPRDNDQISLRFADGNFGAVPTGIFRSWYRVSASESVVLRPENIQNTEIRIPYRGKDQQDYELRLIFSLNRTVSNSAPAETNEQIKQRAPQVYYTQDRMVTGEDYNVFPLTRGSEIVKIKAVNRTHSGHSRFIDINDPTGAFQNTFVLGDDGALWADSEPALTEVSADSFTNQEIAEISTQQFARNQFLQNFFHSIYRSAYQTAVDSQTVFDLIGTEDNAERLFWRTVPRRDRGQRGVLTLSPDPNTSIGIDITQDIPVRRRLVAGSKIKFVNPNQLGQPNPPTEFQWATVRSVTQRTVQGDTEFEISEAVPESWVAVEMTPAFRRAFTEIEVDRILRALNVRSTFGIGYNIDGNNYTGEWYVISSVTDPDVNNDFNLTDISTSSGDLRNNTNSWLIHASYNAPDNVWIFTSRGRRYVFESDNQVRFFFDENYRIVDVQRGQALRDVIELLSINTRVNPPEPQSTQGLPRKVDMNIQSVLMYEDGYRDPRKVIVRPVDQDQDAVPDDPLILEEIVQNFGDPQSLYFRRSTDFNGYEYFELFKGNYVTLSSVTSANFISEDSTVAGQAPAWIVSAGDSQPDITARSLDLLILTGTATISQVVNQLNSQSARAADFAGTAVYDSATDKFYTLEVGSSATQTQSVLSNDYARATGRSFTLNNQLSQKNPLHFRWEHFAPLDNRIDPSISNIIDMFLVTSAYFDEVQEWKDRNRSADLFPDAPTGESLRIQFGDLDRFKTLSDQLVYKPGQFKLLFGRGAEPELQARFKVVKLPTTTLTDNEVKSRVIDAVDQYFDIANWDFGERFFYTELSAYIHQQLANIISTVVIVPQKAESVFGNLFEIKSEPNELFLSTATVADVDVVRNLTDTNLRIAQ